MTMADQSETPVALNRAVLSLIGGLAGLSFWLLSDKLESLIDNPQAYLFLSALGVAFFASVLAMAGPLSVGRAVLSGLVVALVAAALLTWASLRFDVTDDFMRTGHPLAAFAVIVSIPLPFLIAAQRPDEGWRSYPALFNHAWTIVVRYAAAWLFVGVFWGVLMLSNGLLQIVGLTVIEDLLKIDAVPWVVTGLVLGLAIAVVNELSDYVSPYLILRLLRLLLPVVLLVMVVFIAALPFNGLSGLFGGLSAAFTLLVMALAGITLVSTALDRSDEEAVHSPAMRLFTQALALLLPVMAALAGYAIWERVAQYGWTPDRLAGASVAVVVAAYALLYAVSVLWHQRWMARIRRINTAMALAVVVGAMLWLTPLINPQRLATADQLARYRSGEVSARALDLWSIGRQWGRAGQAGIARLAANREGPDAALLQDRLTRLKDATSRSEFEREARDAAAEETLAQVLALLPIVSAPDPMARKVLEILPPYQLRDLRDACRRKTAAGNPGCVLLIADFLPAYPGKEAVLAYRPRPQSLRWQSFRSAGQGVAAVGSRLLSPDGTLRVGRPAIGMIDALVAGDYSIEPVDMKALHTKDGILFIVP